MQDAAAVRGRSVRSHVGAAAMKAHEQFIEKLLRLLLLVSEKVTHQTQGEREECVTPLSPKKSDHMLKERQGLWRWQV